MLYSKTECSDVPERSPELLIYKYKEEGQPKEEHWWRSTLKWTAIFFLIVPGIVLVNYFVTRKNRPKVLK